jgi:hypothetical protein
MWPSIGLKSAVIVVGGCEKAAGAGVGDVGDSGGSLEEGGVASGSVVKRIPVETAAHQASRSSTE